MFLLKHIQFKEYVMPGKKAVKRKSYCLTAQGGKSERPRNEAVKAAWPAGCNQTRVTRLFHRWLIWRILWFISMPQTVLVTMCRWFQYGSIVSLSLSQTHTPLNSDILSPASEINLTPTSVVLWTKSYARSEFCNKESWFVAFLVLLARLNSLLTKNYGFEWHWITMWRNSLKDCESFRCESCVVYYDSRK